MNKEERGVEINLFQIFGKLFLDKDDWLYGSHSA